MYQPSYMKEQSAVDSGQGMWWTMPDLRDLAFGELGGPVRLPLSSVSTALPTRPL